VWPNISIVWLDVLGDAEAFGEGLRPDSRTEALWPQIIIIVTMVEEVSRIVRVLPSALSAGSFVRGYVIASVVPVASCWSSAVAAGTTASSSSA
jgi:hypothetical protein